MISREIVHLGADNRIDLILKVDSGATTLVDCTSFSVVFSGVTVSSIANPTFFNWTSGTTGELRLKFGAMTTVAAGAYDAELWVYDAVNTNGIYWGDFPVLVKG